MSISLSDYTLFAPGQGYFTDWVLQRRPDMQGQLLHQHAQKVSQGEQVSIVLPAPPLCAVIVHGSESIPVEGCMEDVQWRCTAPCEDELRVVYAAPEPNSFDPMHPDAGDEIIREFFGMFEQRFPGECGKGLNFFFSDELNFGIHGKLWDDFFADAFIARKGYDIRPLLYLVFCEGNPEAVSMRLDYYDVIVALEEENYFRKVCRWHEERGMTYGCDHGSRGYDVVEFGDYMRTQKYNQGPGCDQPGLASDIIKNKVAASIAHLHHRPRVWLEGFYGSGWGTTSTQLTDAIARNYVMGQNLLSLHGLYDSTHGGWWEWAPPCNCFRMPYWKHLSALTGAVERLSYLMTRGERCCEAAIMYPVSAVDGGLDGQKAVDTAFALGRGLYSHGVDFDFLDRASLCAGVAAEQFRFIVVPEMRVMRGDEYRALLDAAQRGVQVVSIGALPTFGPDQAAELAAALTPLCFFAADVPEALAYLLGHAGRDVQPASTEEFYLQHRRYGDVDICMTYGIPKGERCLFRARGKAVWMNPWDGRAYGIPNAVQTPEGVVLDMPVASGEFAVFAFGDVEPDAMLDCAEPVATLPLDDVWDFDLLPTMDNTWGDYELPATEGLLPCQVKEVRCGDEAWRISYGPYFLTKEAFPTEEAYRAALLQAAAGRVEGFAPYVFSMRYGVEDLPGHQGYHGMKGQVSDDFLTIGAAKLTNTSDTFLPYEQGFGRVFFTHVVCEEEVQPTVLCGDMKPDALYVNGMLTDPDGPVMLHCGANRVAAGYRHPGRTHLIFAVGEVKPTGYPLAMTWYRHPAVLPFDCLGRQESPTTFCFTAPPGLQWMEIAACGDVQAVMAGGKALRLTRSAGVCIAALDTPADFPCEARITLSGTGGCRGVAAFAEPIRLFCVLGRMPAGDWSRIDGLKYYAGGAAYSQRVTLTEAQCGARTELHLSDLTASAEVLVNGRSMGVRVAPPWQWRIGSALHPAENDIRVEVYNTIGNHYGYIPTRYRSGIVSGLTGRAWLTHPSQNGII